jgi:hypothetical protein
MVNWFNYTANSKMSESKKVSDAEVNSEMESIYAPLFSLILQSGCKIRAKDMFVTMTYGRVLEGWPIEEFLQSDLDNLSKRYSGIFGKFPVHVLSSPIKRLEVKNPLTPPDVLRLALLPKVEVAAFFVSSPVKDPEMQASGLIVVWHQNSRDTIPCPDSMNKLLGLDWAALARDFEY